MLHFHKTNEFICIGGVSTCTYNFVEFVFLRQYVQPCLLKNPKYTFYTIKSSLKLAYYHLDLKEHVMVLTSLRENLNDSK